jgi:hypothetical protein
VNLESIHVGWERHEPCRWDDATTQEVAVTGQRLPKKKKKNTGSRIMGAVREKFFVEWCKKVESFGREGEGV